MTKYQNIFLFLLRIVMGWLFLHAGLVKIMNSSWSAAGYLNGAQHFQGFFHWLASPALLPLTNFVNEWALALLGISLILGIFVRYAAVLGAVLMLLYYVPLNFPNPDANSFIVDDHIVYLFVLLYLSAADAGRFWGLESKLPWSRGATPT